MAGVKGSGNAPPKRDSQRRRSNPPAGGPAQKATGAARVSVPKVDPKWHPVAKRWFQSLAKSGQAQFFEPSDWGTAFVLAESMSRELNPQPMVVGHGADAHVEMVALPPKGASLAAWLKGMTALLTTEGDRRRLRLEFERPGAEDSSGDVTWLEHYRQSGGAA